MLKQLIPSRKHDLRKNIQTKDLLAGKQRIEQARDIRVPPYVVREHSQGIGEREVRLRAADVRAQRRVYRRDDVRDQAKLGDGWAEGWQHEVADAQAGEALDGGRAGAGGQDEQEYLADVVVPLEVAEVRLSPEHLGDQVRERGLLLVELRLRVVWELVSDGVWCGYSRDSRRREGGIPYRPGSRRSYGRRLASPGPRLYAVRASSTNRRRCPGPRARRRRSLIIPALPKNVEPHTCILFNRASEEVREGRGEWVGCGMRER